ncbi:MAG: hypothetical protein GEU82_14920 [Luteitalea sp.]|nr:hypothetical protein [Luteitalea sp.]
MDRRYSRDRTRVCRVIVGSGGFNFATRFEHAEWKPEQPHDYRDRLSAARRWKHGWRDRHHGIGNVGGRDEHSGQRAVGARECNDGLERGRGGYGRGCRRHAGSGRGRLDDRRRGSDCRRNRIEQRREQLQLHPRARLAGSHGAHRSSYRGDGNARRQFDVGFDIQHEQWGNRLQHGSSQHTG